MDYIDSDVAPSRSVHQGQGVLLREVSVANLGRTMLRSGLRCGLTECSIEKCFDQVAPGDRACDECKTEARAVPQ